MNNIAIKLLIIGESGVGKSSLIRRFVENKFDENHDVTIGMDFKSKIIEINGENVKLALWDTAGAERFRSLTPSFYRKAMGAILVYDITNKESLLKLESWLDELENYCNNPNIVTIVVGNKIDMDREISRDEGLKFARKHRALFIETSAKCDQFVADVFREIVEKIFLLSLITYAFADVKFLTDQNIDLFKYNPGDIYTLPKDVDDDKPVVLFNGDVKKAKVDHYQNLNGNKKFKLDIRTQNGIELQQVGKLKDDKTFVVSGAYSFTGADGKRYKTRYTADEFGYHPKTELDLDIPEPQVQRTESQKSGKTSIRTNKNRFQFLNQNLNLEFNQQQRRESDQIGDNNSFSHQFEDNPGRNGYNYNPPEYQLESLTPLYPEYLPPLKN